MAETSKPARFSWELFDCPPRHLLAQGLANEIRDAYVKVIRSIRSREMGRNVRMSSLSVDDLWYRISEGERGVAEGRCSWLPVHEDDLEKMFVPGLGRAG